MAAAVGGIVFFLEAFLALFEIAWLLTISKDCGGDGEDMHRDEPDDGENDDVELDSRCIDVSSSCLATKLA